MSAYKYGTEKASDQCVYEYALLAHLIGKTDGHSRLQDKRMVSHEPAFYWVYLGIYGNERASVGWVADSAGRPEKVFHVLCSCFDYNQPAEC